MPSSQTFQGACSSAPQPHLPCTWVSRRSVHMPSTCRVVVQVPHDDAAPAGATRRWLLTRRLLTDQRATLPRPRSDGRGKTVLPIAGLLTTWMPASATRAQPACLRFVLALVFRRAAQRTLRRVVARRSCAHTTLLRCSRACRCGRQLERPWSRLQTVVLLHRIAASAIARPCCDRPAFPHPDRQLQARALALLDGRAARL